MSYTSNHYNLKCTLKCIKKKKLTVTASPHTYSMHSISILKSNFVFDFSQVAFD